MINLLLGGPGGGKSYEAVVFHILPALQRGRKVVTNLPLEMDRIAAIDSSYPALIEIREKTLAKPPEPLSRDQMMALNATDRNARLRWRDRAFANVEDFADTWRHPVDGYGPLYVIDECHFPWPVGLTQVAVEEWMSMHRHHNVDVLAISQSSNKMSRAIRDLVQVCYKVRKAVALGKSDGYIRKVLDGVGGGEVATTERKYQTQYFGIWRSHTQGMALAEHKADDVAPFLVKFNRFKYAWLIFSALCVVWAFWPKDKPKKAPPSTNAYVKADGRTDFAALNAALAKERPEAEGKATPAPVEKKPSEPEPEAVPEPFGGKGLHLAGRMSMAGKTVWYFVVSFNNQRISETRSTDLVQAGYRWEPLTECAGTLRWKTKAIPVTCDAPAPAPSKEAKPENKASPSVGKEAAPVVLVGQNGA